MRFHLCLRGLAAAALAASLPLLACNDPVETPDAGGVLRRDASAPGEDAATAPADSGWRCTAPQGCPGTDEPCRSRTCTDGVCGFQNASEGTNCGTQMVCNGQGACVGCLAASDCPGADTECATRSCTAGTCGFRYAAAGTPLAQQDVGDCLVKQCDGHGGTRSVAEDTDLPVDGNPCTEDVCRDGVTSNPPVTAGLACGNDQKCDGAGRCVGCIGPSDCPGADTECRSRTCTAGVCGVTFSAKGTRLAAQQAGDCHEVRCDGAGGASDEVDDSDLPVDSLPCTRDLCQAGTPSNPPEPASTACGTGLLCDGAGACVACLQPSDCGSDSECQVRTCNAGVCGVSHTASGTALMLQTTGDCHTLRCDGSGGTTNAVDDEDRPVDGNPCTSDVCTAGVGSNPLVAAGQGCGAGLVCDATGGCVGCIQPSDCAGTDTECQVRTCSAGTCGVANSAAGTPVTQQVAGDCHTVRCNGSGGTANTVDDEDRPVDGNPCTNDLCSAGVKANPAVAAGTACPGGLCDGTGACVACLQPSDCSGSDTECHVRTCNAGSCGVANASAGKPIAAQVAGDCHRKECDGSGGVVDNVDDADRPADDGNQCTDERCAAGVASHPSSSPGTSCTQTGGALCDGAGACVECLVATTCPGTDTECRTRTCNAGRCGFSHVANGTPLAAQTAGDCKLAICDGAGNTANSSDPADLPVDGNQCTSDVCTNGVASNPNTASGSACSQNGGAMCNGSGACVQCVLASTCPGTDTECRTRTCNAGVCGFAHTANGTPVSSQTAGDCHQNVCDGSGNVVISIDDEDRPDDGNACTNDLCTAGVASHSNTATGSACSQNGGTVCNGSGSCVQCVTASTCSGTDTECRTRTCITGVCGMAYVPTGSLTSTQTAGDCRVDVSDGSGNVVTANDSSDLPADDGNQCTAEVCSAGFPSHPARPNGSPCTQNGGTVCDGGGTCISLTPPTVTATTPANGGSALASTTIAVTFSTAMNPVTLSGQTTAGGCSGSIQVSLDNFASCIAFASSTPTMTVGNTVATLTPSPRLLVNRTYRIRVTTVATSAGDLGLASAYTSATGFTTTSPNLCDGSVVISQVYGGGGGTSSPFKNDFVELHNRGSTAVTVTGWSIQYASATGSSWQTTALTGSIAPGGYYLVQEGGGTNGADLPTPQVSGSIAMSGTAGKVALVNGTAALTVSCPTNVIDMVAFGSSANCGEGGSPTPAPSSTLAVLRNQAGCGDVGMNSTDFASGAPVPRNSATPANVCACTVLNEANTAAEADYCVLQPPASLTLAASSSSGLVYGRLYEAGVTDPAGAASNVRAQVGWGPVNANPEFESTWRWSNATFNAQLGNDDEYQAAFTAPSTPGAYQFGFRFSLDQGVSWTYCDLDGAGWNPTLVFGLDRLGSLTVN